MHKSARGVPRGEELIGRERNLATLRQFLDEGACLITVTGPPGVGKTSLARHLAAAFAATWCDVTEAATSAAFEHALAKSLGLALPQRSSASTSELIGAALAEGPRLVVLDNFEHLVEIASAQISEWVAAAPELQILVTSRGRLHLPLERVHDLAPLGVPTSDLDVGASDAVKLWVARVRARDSSYVLGDDAVVVARLVRELDGLPLAIELAASRCTALGPATLLSRIHQRLELLDSSRSGPPGRHTALRAAIDVSWNLLDAAGRRALAQCSVFRDGFSLEAVEAVVELGEEARGRTVLDVIQELRERSLLQSYVAEELPGEQRFRMFLSIRAYAQEKLIEQRGCDDTNARYRRCVIELVERLAIELVGAAPGPAYVRLCVERANTVAVIQQCFEGTTMADTEAALRVLIALELQLRVEGPFLGPPAAFIDVLDRCPDLDPSLRTRALRVLGQALARAGESDRASAALARAVAAAGAYGACSLEAEAEAEIALAVVSLHAGRIADADQACSRAQSLATVSGDSRVQAEAFRCVMLLFLAGHVGDFKEAVEKGEAAVALLRAAGAAIEERIAARDLSLLYCEGAEFDLARATTARYLGTSPWPGFLGQYARASEHYAMGKTELVAGEWAAAQKILQGAVELQRAPGDVWLVPSSRALQAIAVWQLGFLADARSTLLKAIHELRSKGLSLIATQFTAVMGAVEADLGHIDEARRLLAIAAAETSQRPGTALDAVVELGRGHLDLALSRVAGDPAEIEKHAAAARGRIAGLEVPAEGRTRAAISFSGVRVLALALRSAIEGKTPPKAVEAPVLCIGPGALWLELPGGQCIRRDRRPVMHRILLALAEARRDAPGRALDLGTLLTVGWPGEKIIPTAAKSRLHMMISRIRDLGLRDLLRSDVDGYALDIALEVALAQEPSS